MIVPTTPRYRVPARRAVLVAIAMALSTLAIAPAYAQMQTVRLQPSDKVRPREGLATFPRVQQSPGVDLLAQQRINNALAAEEGRAARAAQECRSDFSHGLGKNRGKVTPEDIWSRQVTVTMQGPRFLSYTATDSYDCGGPYPNDGIPTPLVFDLTTGWPANWLKFFPAGAQATLDTGPQGTRIGLVAWPELTRRARASAGPDCRDVFDADASDTGHEFGITLDGKSGTLVATPADLPHAVQACGDAVVLTTADLRRLGFSAELVSALEDARARTRSAAGQGR